MKKIVVIFIVLSLAILFSAPIGSGQSALQIEDNASLELGQDETPVSNLDITFSNTIRNNSTVTADIRYVFTFNDSVENYRVAVSDQIEKIESWNVNKDENKMIVKTSYEYRYISDYLEEDLKPVRPTVRVVQHTHYQDIGRSIPTGIYRYEDYHHSVSNVTTESDLRVQVGGWNILLGTETHSTDPSYTLSSASAEKIITVAGDTSSERLLEIREVSETFLSLDSRFNTTQQLSVYITEKSLSNGLITGLDKEVSNIYLQTFDTNKYVIAHEFAHSMQNFETNSETDWWTEGSAEYLGVMMGYQSGLDRDYFGDSSVFNYWSKQYENSTQLNDQSTWNKKVDYMRGAKLAYLVDSKIRQQTNGNKSIVHLLERFNQVEDPLTHQTAVDIIQDMTTEEFATEYHQMVTEDRDINVQSHIEDPYIPRLDIDKVDVQIYDTG